MALPTKSALSETNKYLDELKANIIRDAKRNLSRKKKNSLGNLSKSLKGTIKQSRNSIQITFDMNAYGFFQDRGVKGKTSGKSLSGFKYTDKRPPIKSILPWLKKRGIKGRDKKTGRFTTQKSLAFIIANSIYHKGIKPSMFFTKPFEKYAKQIPKELIERYELDLTRLFDSIKDTKLNDKK